MGDKEQVGMDYMKQVGMGKIEQVVMGIKKDKGLFRICDR